MDKKVLVWGVISIVILILLVIVSSGSSKSSETIENKSFPVADKIEVFMFHTTQRCPTCIRIGQLSRATVEERFPEQLKLGKIDFREINIDLPENKTLAEKFQAGGSSLFINSITNSQDNIKEDITVWQFAGGSADKFKDYLSNKLNTILGI